MVRASVPRATWSRSTSAAALAALSFRASTCSARLVAQSKLGSPVQRFSGSRSASRNHESGNAGPDGRSASRESSETKITSAPPTMKGSAARRRVCIGMRGSSAGRLSGLSATPACARGSGETIVGNRLPVRCVVDELAVGGPDSGVAVERAQPNADPLRVVRVAAPERRAAEAAEVLRETVGRLVGADETPLHGRFATIRERSGPTPPPPCPSAFGNACSGSSSPRRAAR